MAHKIHPVPSIELRYPRLLCDEPVTVLVYAADPQGLHPRILRAYARRAVCSLYGVSRADVVAAERQSRFSPGDAAAVELCADLDCVAVSVVLSATTALVVPHLRRPPGRRGAPVRQAGAL